MKGTSIKKGIERRYVELLILEIVTIKENIILCKFLVNLRKRLSTLQNYDGVGCAKLLKFDLENGGMLLERLVPGIMLSAEMGEMIVLDKYIKVWKAMFAN
jgi:hypothetical protein